jgi:hypothetical protein
MDQEYVIIKPGLELPNDFLDKDAYDINREKYIVEIGDELENWWRNEYESSAIGLEIIGAILIGSDLYHDIRFRIRNNEDQKWDKNNTPMAKLIRARLINP